MPAVAPRRWTARDVHALPDESGKRFECVDGELLVHPSPRLAHQYVVTVLWRVLDEFVRAHRLGVASVSPSDFELDAHTLVQPDVFVLPLVDGRRPRGVAEIGQPLLFVEVLSPSTARNDRVIKRARYQRAGIEYWIVDPEARLVECWLPEAERPSMHTETIRWQPASDAPTLVVELAALFEEALGER